MGQDSFPSYQYGECRTGTGQIIEFTCSPGLKEQVGEFFQKNVRTIDIPTTKRINVEHGSYGQYTRYDVIQHNYAGGGPSEGGWSGYIEVLEIKNPPDRHWGFVINEYTSHDGGTFTEWETLENARVAFEHFWRNPHTKNKFLGLNGFKRHIACGGLTPWFYAVGDEQLIGDYAFPKEMRDDAVYRLGQKFVVFDHNDVPAIKTCMGTRFIKRNDEQQYRLVYWDDGRVWNENDKRSDPPRPIEEDEMWVTEAVKQFKQLLAGRSTDFTINFTDGNKFIGKLKRTDHRTPCAEGDYLLIVRLKDKDDPLEGWVKNFKPTKETPDIIKYVTQQYKKSGKEVEFIKIKERQIKRGKKWSGVFFSSSR